VDAPVLLEEDLTGRPYTFVNKGGHSVKRLMGKEQFKDKHDDKMTGGGCADRG